VSKEIRLGAVENNGGLGQGIVRVAAILKAIGKAHRSGIRLIDLALATELNKSTLHRLLSGLCQAGLVEHNISSGLYYLSVEMFVLGVSAANRDALIDLASDHMRRLEHQTSDTVFLSIRAGSDAICVYRVEGRFPIKVLTLSIGDRRPLGVGAGSLALLAFHGDSDVEAIVERNRESLSAYSAFSPADLFSLVEATRRRGYSFNDGRIIPEMCALGVPILGSDGRPLAAISLAAIRSRMQPERQGALVSLLSAEARELEARLSQRAIGLAHIEVGRRTSF